MLFALDKNGQRVHINSAKRNEHYFCPCCGSEMVMRLGDVRSHHFSHRIEDFCKDSWHYDMTEWHYNWQSRFNVECQEVVKEFNGEKHRADVLIEESKVVFEFQHSPLSPEEFEERNNFYNKLGYKVIWVFDVEEQYENEMLENYQSNLWSWKRPRRTFNFFNYRNNNVILFLELSNENEYLVKVTWCTNDNGLSKFATDGNEYDGSFIVQMYCKNVGFTKKEYRFSDLYDKLVKINSRDHTTYYFGCPISKTHKCASTSIDIPESKYDEIMPCCECKFNNQGNNYGHFICKKRFKDLQLDGDTLVKIESRDLKGFINKISYFENGIIKYLNVPTFTEKESKNIFDLWNEDYKIVTFKNVRTGNYIRIRKNPKDQFLKYKKVYGWFSKDRYSFPRESTELYDIDKKEWVVVWFKKTIDD